MGNIGSRPDEPIYLRDQQRFSISNLIITNGRSQTVLKASAASFPAARFVAQKDQGDDSPVEYIQDPDATNGAPVFLLRLPFVDELTFTFTCTLRQQSAPGASDQGAQTFLDTQISGLTYIFGSTPKEVENLSTREFHSDPNLHKKPNVELLGDFSTGGNPAAQFTWSWKWRPPKPSEDRGGGWRVCTTFVEYNQRTHRLDPLASLNFWVHNAQRNPFGPTRSLHLDAPPARLRVPSSQSIDSRFGSVSDSEGEGSYRDPRDASSPPFGPIPEDGLGLAPIQTAASNLTTPAGPPVKVDVATCKPGDDPALNEDGPVFRATMRSLELKTGNMRLRMKRVLRTAEAARAAQHTCNQAVLDFTEALREASASNANAVQPALEHYFDKIAKEILHYEKQNASNLQKIIIEPISKLYNIEIKQADFKKREFDDDSKEYYSYVSKYLGQRSESLKEKKQKQSDEKYQTKRRTFELKRFDYSSFMHDLNGGRKEQEVLSHLTRYADAQARGYLTTAKKVEELVPQLDALVAEVKATDQDFEMQRAEREEKRRILEKSTKLISEDGVVVPPGFTQQSQHSYAIRTADGNDSLPKRTTSVAHSFSQSPPQTSYQGGGGPGASNSLLGPPPSSSSFQPGTSPQAKFKGIRDLEDPTFEHHFVGAFRKEGLLWALSRPGTHVDPRGITKSAWHKFWIVLDQGKLSEYVNWKEKLDLHMDPIDLRMASVREARNSDRRFCFEIITPQFTRVYQAPSEDDMRSWIAAINNALKSAFETKTVVPPPSTPSPTNTHGKDIAAVLTGKSSSFSGHRQVSNPNRTEATRAVGRHATVGDKPPVKRMESEYESSALLQRIRAADEGNKMCADCGSEQRVDWCSINLGILLCIECSGIHRSLGTHITKIRSLTLDTQVFTPDLVEILLSIGNRVSNMIWEARLDHFLKPSPRSTREQRLHFITSKYAERQYVAVPPAVQSGSQNPDDFLLTSIKRNTIHSVVHALALRANPNATDRVRSTHAVFLALAAADPALPAQASFSSHDRNLSSSTIRGGASGSTTPISPTSLSQFNVSGSQPGSPDIRKPFAVAELLLQNGADLPTEPCPFPLSQTAKQYLEFKTDQKFGRQPTAAPLSPPTSSGHGANSRRTSRSDMTFAPSDDDQLSALPRVPSSSANPSAVGVGSGAAVPGSISTIGFAGGNAALDRERPLKRNSSGRISSLSAGLEGLTRK